jgi:hypothetical protein
MYQRRLAHARLAMDHQRLTPTPALASTSRSRPPRDETMLHGMQKVTGSNLWFHVARPSRFTSSLDFRASALATG